MRFFKFISMLALFASGTLVQSAQDKEPVKVDKTKSVAIAVVSDWNSAKSQAVKIFPGDAIVKMLQKSVIDSQAPNGPNVISIDPMLPSNHFAIRFDILDALKSGALFPGMKYVLGTPVKVNKSGSTGSAFKMGIYDLKEKAWLIAPCEQVLSAVPDGAWQSYELPAFNCKSGLRFTILTAGNPEVRQLIVNGLYFRPGDTAATKMHEFLGKSPDGIASGFSPSAEGWFSLDVKKSPETLELACWASAYKGEIGKPCAQGIAVQYFDGKEYTHTVFHELGLNKNTKESLSMISDRTKLETINHRLDFDKAGIIKIPIARNAPLGWNGQIKLFMISMNAPNFWSGILIGTTLENLDAANPGYGPNPGVREELIIKLKKRAFSSNLESLEQ